MMRHLIYCFGTMEPVLCKFRGLPELTRWRSSRGSHFHSTLPAFLPSCNFEDQQRRKQLHDYQHFCELGTHQLPKYLEVAVSQLVASQLTYLPPFTSSFQCHFYLLSCYQDSRNNLFIPPFLRLLMNRSVSQTDYISGNVQLNAVEVNLPDWVMDFGF